MFVIWLEGSRQGVKMQLDSGNGSERMVDGGQNEEPDK